ncbi:hypothetical protein ACFTAO_46385 [Paenibacillus rhizoplanae]
MKALPGLLRADLLKMQRTPFLLIHLLTPLIGGRPVPGLLFHLCCE